ncbi:DDE-domain-containing protein [Stereum hirsutum FP-91666 SS1]|uniref:DDE-domain-containing protein n=1 Tax=Stereum hirsutum (strain FP-91666) TaxID=721885 RepID=UPI000444A393|nr:DDE-domain-containing protein [Stereum hirsutum FP-91666 SS1]EIM83427.1 DDE-domain-containing protein [Stereum hirsutum FP-91666 SS1]
MQVPENERLRAGGWVQSFCKAWNLKEHRRHGEAGSVDLEAVEREHARISVLLKEYDGKDILNFDETAFFPFAPPGRGLSTEQMSGKKKDKFRITLGFLCNATGTEKFPIFFIGRFKSPRCFKHRDPESLGFYYWNNKKAWMNAELFEEWVTFFASSHSPGIILTCHF